jgi:GNAT superfamily N-acetyltransferase
MIFREAELSDIKQMQVVRHLVKENTLSNPNLVPDQDVAFYISVKGKGWVCEVEGQLVGFSIVDLQESSVWALFVDPAFAEKGIGKELHTLMIDWYFLKKKNKLVLGTAAETRAEKFYELQGWIRAGSYANGEVKFELNYEQYANRSIGPHS